MINELISSPITDSLVGFLGLLVSIIAIILPLIQSKLENKKCRPCYAIMTKCFIFSNERNRFDKLSVKYENDDVDQLSITTFAFWNSGKIRLNKQDYGHVKPSIECKEGKILDYKVRHTIGAEFFTLHPEVNDGKLCITFDEEIGFNQGYVIDIIHTGSFNKDLCIKMKFNEIKLKRVHLYNRAKSSILENVSIALLLVCALCLLLLFTIAAFSQTDFKLFVEFLAILIMTIIATTLKIREMFIPYKGIPKEFYPFFYEIDF